MTTAALPQRAVGPSTRRQFESLRLRALQPARRAAPVLRRAASLRPPAAAAGGFAGAPGRRPYTAVLIIPTGVGAAIGGFAGDSMPVARAVASVADVLITHPNVLNGAMLYWPLPNALYVEGYGLDMFAAGEWGLRPVQRNRLGLLLDAGIEPELRLRHMQVVDAARATLGLEIVQASLTDAPLGVSLSHTSAGASTGTLGEPGSLLRGAAALLEAGCEAVAVVARFPEEDEEDEGGELGEQPTSAAATESSGSSSDSSGSSGGNPSSSSSSGGGGGISAQLADYRQGLGVDALAGVEAIISHAIVRDLGVPCAHAPALGPLPVEPTLAPAAAAEELGHTFLPCVLAGLSRAPQFVRALPAPPGAPGGAGGPSLFPGAVRPGRGFSWAEYQQQLSSPPEAGARPLTPPGMPVGGGSDLWAADVDAVIVPADACGSPAVLAFAGLAGRSRGASRRPRPLIVAVEENATVMDVTPERLGIAAVRVANYTEALGVLAAHKAGIAHEALRVPRLKQLELRDPHQQQQRSGA